MSNAVEEKKEEKNSQVVEKMFKAGAHFGYAKARRHPSAKQFIFGAKNKVEIFDLEKTEELLENAKNFVKNLAKEGGQLLFVGGKSESREVVRKAAESLGMPYVAGRWIGGTFTNQPEIKKRIERLLDLTSKKEKGELAKYTKKERLLIDREIEKLKTLFSGIVSMKGTPKAMFVVDMKKEKNAVTEAEKTGVPVISLSSSDCDMSEADYPIPANDSSVSSIKFFVEAIAEAYKEGAAQASRQGKN